VTARGALPPFVFLQVRILKDFKFCVLEVRILKRIVENNGWLVAGMDDWKLIAPKRPTRALGTDL